MKKSAKLVINLPNFERVKEADFVCQDCVKAKFVRKVAWSTIPDPELALDRLEGDILTIKPLPYNKKPVRLFLVNRKSRFR